AEDRAHGQIHAFEHGALLDVQPEIGSGVFLLLFRVGRAVKIDAMPLHCGDELDAAAIGEVADFVWDGRAGAAAGAEAAAASATVRLGSRTLAGMVVNCAAVSSPGT